MGLLQDYLKKLKGLASNQVSNFRVGMNTARNPNESIFTRSAQGLLHGTGKTLADAGSLATKIQSSRVANVLNPATLMIRQNQPRMQNEINNLRTNLNKVAPTTRAGKVGSFIGENLPAMLLPATKGITATKVANPLTRLAYNSLLRGGENAAYNTAVKVARNEKITPKGVLGDVAVGAAFNTALSPKQLIKGVKYQNIVDAMDAPLANKYTKVIQDGKITANLYKPKTNLKTFSVKDFAVKYLGSDPMVNNYKIDLSGSVDAHFDPQSGKLLSWSTDNPVFARNLQDGKLTFGLSTRNVKPSENPLSNEARKYKSAEEFSQKYLKDLADENRGVYDTGVYDKFKEASGVPLYKTDWFPAKVNSLSKDEIKSIIAKYPERVKQLSQPKKWGSGTIKAQPYEVERSILFEHFKPEYDNQVRKGLTNFYNKSLPLSTTPKTKMAKNLDRISPQQEILATQSRNKSPEIAKSLESNTTTLVKNPSKILGETPNNVSFTNSKQLINDNVNSDPVQKIITALKETKPLSKEQQILNASNRKKQYAKMMSARGKVSGEQGYFAELGALKGGAKKANFESVRPQLTQTDIDSLFNRVNESNIGDWEKINAKGALTKLLSKGGGSIPTQNELKLLNDVFGSDFTKAILDKRSTWQKIVSGAGEVLNLPRSLMASFDLSAPFRQGVVMTSRPKQFFPAFMSMFKQAGSEKAFRAVQEEISTRPTYKLMRDSKLALTDIGPLMSNREEAFMSNLGEKIPVLKYGIKASNRAYTGFLNKLRADVFDDLVSKAKLLGNDNPDIAADIAKFVNSATGRGDLGSLNKAAPALNGLFFSPRLMASRINMLNPMFYANLDPFVRKEALKSMLTMGSVATTVLGLAKAGGADVETDPRSADFGKIKVGDTRYDILGGFQQYVVLASRLINGNMVSSTTGKEISLTEGYKPTTRLDIIINFLKSKENPVMSYITGAAEGTTQLGQQFKPVPELINRFIPMFAQDVVDLTEDKGFAKSIGMELPSVLGVGVQTYGKQIPIIGQTPTGKSTIKWRSPYDIGERIVNKVTGQPGSPFTKEEQISLDKARRKELKTKADVDKVVSEVTKKINKGGAVNDVIELPDGRGLYVTDRGIQYADTPDEARFSKFKSEFKKSDDTERKFNGKTYYKSSSGSILERKPKATKVNVKSPKLSKSKKATKAKKGKLFRVKGVAIKAPSIKVSTKVKISKPNIKKKAIGGKGITKVNLPITKRRTA